MMENPNQHILAYLDYYVSNPEPPYYALMIAGKWGVGKTWLVKRYFESNPSHKYIYVSLYGAKSAEEVAERIYAARHPIIASKGAMIAGRFVKRFVKATTTIDLDSDLPEAVDLVRQKASRYDGTIVLDDIERCAIEGQELWGFVNHLIEHEGAKTVLIACEDEIKNDKFYHRTKEKNIGMTLSVCADAARVLDCLVQEYGEPAATVLRSHSARILQLFERSECASLRVLRFAVRDFCRIFAGIPLQIREETAALSRLLDSTLHLAFGVYGGDLKPSDIQPLEISMLLGGPKEPSPLARVTRKYSGCGLGTIFPDLDWWRSFFERGELRGAKLVDEYSELVKGTAQPNWLRLAHFDKLSDAQFESLIEETWEWLLSGGYRSIGAILHVSATHMWAVATGVTRSSRTLVQIRDQAKKALDALEESEMCESLREDLNGPLHAYAGVRYAANDVAEFKEVVDHAEGNIRAVKLNIVRQEAARLLVVMREGGKAFAAALGVSIEEDGQLEKLALEASVLAAVDAEEFVNVVLSLGRAEQDKIVGALFARLKSGFAGEREWLQTVTGKLDEKNSGPSLRVHILRNRLSRLVE